MYRCLWSSKILNFFKKLLFNKLKCLICFIKAKEFENIKIIRYEESIYYANVDHFKYKIIKLCNVKPDVVRKLLKKAESKANKSHISLNWHHHKTADEILNDIKIKYIILDFSCVNYIDSQGVNAIVQVNDF